MLTRILVGTLLMAQPTPAAMHVEVRPAITVAVQGEDEVPAAEWSRARRLATRILNRAGLAAIWESGTSCSPPALCLHLSRTRPATLHADAAGYAVLLPGAGHASVYLPGVERTASQLGVDRATVLGAAMAHEIGHLLLGPAHSYGVMSTRFDRPQMRAAERGELLFRDEDARRLQRLSGDRSPTGPGECNSPKQVTDCSTNVSPARKSSISCGERGSPVQVDELHY